jgi:hypothetical protein
MVKIDFDEPSVGNVSSDKTSLAIKNTGNGVALSCESNSDAVTGKSKDSYGVYGESTNNIGIIGVGKIVAVHAETNDGTAINATGKDGVKAVARGQAGIGIYGSSTGYQGVGVYGQCNTWFGVMGVSDNKDGVRGEAHSANGSGVAGVNDRGGPGIYGQGNPAGRFNGNVEVTGDIKVTGEITVTKDIKLINGDFAEDFDILEANVEAGTVMVLNESGSLIPSHQEYDRKVAGVVSGAGGYKPAIVMDSKDTPPGIDRLPIALMGKVYCKVDARDGPVEIGDLLTTSSTIGYAMKAEDPTKAFGAVIGKSLACLKEGTGMIPILVTLQ